MVNSDRRYDKLNLLTLVMGQVVHKGAVVGDPVFRCVDEKYLKIRRVRGGDIELYRDFLTHRNDRRKILIVEGVHAQAQNSKRIVLGCAEAASRKKENE
jgi:hypothetical protein